MHPVRSRSSHQYLTIKDSSLFWSPMPMSCLWTLSCHLSNEIQIYPILIASSYMTARDRDQFSPAKPLRWSGSPDTKTEVLEYKACEHLRTGSFWGMTRLRDVQRGWGKEERRRMRRGSLRCRLGNSTVPLAMWRALCAVSFPLRMLLPGLER